MFGGLFDGALGKLAAAAGLAGLLGLGYMAVGDSRISTMVQENRGLIEKMTGQYGNGGMAFSASGGEDVTAAMIRDRMVPENLVDRSTTLPTLRNEDGGTITLTLQRDTFSTSWDALRADSCGGMVTKTDLTRALRSMSVGSTTVTFGTTNAVTKEQLRTLANSCVDNVTVTWAVGH
jgi:hypothetical protein